jgi:hypothetical protein
MPLQKDPVDSEGTPKTEQPTEEELFNNAEEEGPQEVDLEDYFGDPDGEDNVTDHGTPRPAEEPEPDETQVEPAEEPEVEEPAAEDAAEEEPAVEPQEEPPAPETVKIKVQGEELELTQEQLIELAQKGEDYTRKTQALSEREKRLTGYEGLIGLANSDPKFRQYLQTYDANAPVETAEPEPVVDDTPPEDPVERVKWEAKKEALAELQPTIDALKQEISTVRQSVQTKSTQIKRDVDPLGEITHKAMHGYLESLPPQAAQALYEKWDTDAQAYEEGYQWMRGVVAERYAATQEANANAEPSESTPAATPEPVAKPKKVTRKTKEVAPLLESSGAAHVEKNQAGKAKTIKTLQNRIKNQEYDPRDVGDLFDLIDPLD